MGILDVVVSKKKNEKNVIHVTDAITIQQAIDILTIVAPELTPSDMHLDVNTKTNNALSREFAAGMVRDLLR